MFLISGAGAAGKWLSSALCGPKVGKVWRNNNINQCDTLTFMRRSKINDFLNGKELLGWLVNVAERGEQPTNQTVWPESFKVTAVLTTYTGLIFSQC